MKKEIFDHYIDSVCEFYKITREQMLSRKSKSDGSDARQFLWWLCHKRNMPLKYIKKNMDETGLVMSHTTILHGIKTFDARNGDDEDFIRIANKIHSSISI
jgi:chromosomal replication initiation ATPase DnaA